MKPIAPILALVALLCTTLAGAIENPFTDVDPGASYESAVVWAVETGVTTGTSATTFDPDGLCTRGQVVTLLWRSSGSPMPETTASAFTDVSTDSPYATAIAWAVEQGITTGVTATNFAPNDLCTTAQVITFLHRALGTPTGEPTEADAFYTAALAWAVSTELIATTSFDPADLASRAQVVTYLYILAGSPSITVTTGADTVITGDKNEVIAPWISALEAMETDVAETAYGALPVNLSAGSVAVNYHQVLYFLRNESQTISAMGVDGGSVIWDLYAVGEDTTLENIQIYGDKLYFVEVKLSSTTLCSMNLDGSGRTVLVDASGVLDGVGLYTSGYLIYDGRVYFLDDDQGTTTAIVSYDLNMSDGQLVYYNGDGIYVGSGQSLGIANGRVYVYQTKTFGTQGTGISVTLTGQDLADATTEEMISAGLGLALLSDELGKRVVLALDAGVMTRSYVSAALYPNVQDIAIDGVYGCTVDVPLTQVNLVSPSQLFLLDEAGQWLLSLDGATADLELLDGDATPQTLDQRLVVERSEYPVD